MVYLLPRWSLGTFVPSARAVQGISFRCDRDRVRHVLNVVCAVLCSPLKASVLNSGDEDSGKLMWPMLMWLWPIRSNSKHVRKVRNRQCKRRKLWPVDHLAFDQFDAESEDIKNYLERLQEYFTAYDIEDDEDNAAKRRAILLASIGSNCFRVLKDLAFPDAPNTKTFDQLATLLREHFKPTRLKIAERYRFHSAV